MPSQFDSHFPSTSSLISSQARNLFFPSKQTITDTCFIAAIMGTGGFIGSVINNAIPGHPIVSIGGSVIAITEGICSSN